MAVADCLQGVGIPAEQIVIYDRQTAELKGANFTINKSDPGVRCYATGYEGSWNLMGSNIKLASVLLQSDALINIPLLKSHGIGGMTFAMKSHYGSFNRPQDFHQGKIDHARVAQDAQSDGIFPLITNVADLSELELLKTYKRQPTIII